MISSVLLMLIFVTQHKMVLSKPCKGANCNSVKLPLLDNQKAYLFAEMDVSSMNEQLQGVIQKEINSTYNDRTADTKDQIDVHMLQEFTRMQKEMKGKISSVYETALNNLNTSFEEKSEKLTRNTNDRFEILSKSFKEELKTLIREEVKQKFGGTEQKVGGTDKVSMTACMAGKDYGAKRSGYVVKFADVSTSSNINNLSTFRNSGKFEVEVEGMYLVSAWIYAYNKITFSIRKNGNAIAVGVMTGPEGDAINVAATAVVAMELKIKDEVWVQTENTYFIHISWRTSCFTLIKVK